MFDWTELLAASGIVGSIVLGTVGLLLWLVRGSNGERRDTTTAYISSLESQNVRSEKLFERFATEIGNLSKGYESHHDTLAALLEEVKVLNRAVANIELHRLDDTKMRQQDAASLRDLIGEVKKLGDSVVKLAEKQK